MKTSVPTGYVKPTTKPTSYWEPGLAGGGVQPISALTPSPVSTGYVEPGPVVAGSLQYLQPASVGGLVQPMKTSVPTGYVKPTTKPTAYWEPGSSGVPSPVGGLVQPMKTSVPTGYVKPTTKPTSYWEPGLAGGVVQPISALTPSP